MKRMGVVVNPNGAPVALETVTAFVHPGTTPAGTYATNSDGRWDADLADETKQYRIEIGGGSGGTQRVVQAPASIELEYLFVRYGLKVVGGPVDLPANTNIGGVAINVTTLDARYVNLTGDAMSGSLAVTGLLSANGGLGVTGASTLNGAVAVGAAGLSVTGQVLAGGGSAGTPGFAFVGDSNTGLFRNNEGNISLVSNGSIKFSTTAVGADLVGNLTVSGTLNVSGNSGLGGVLYAGTVDVANNLTVHGDMSLSGGLTLYSGMNIPTGNVSIANALTVSDLNVTDDVEIAGSLNHAGIALGFFGARERVKRSVVGSKGGNAALASVIAALVDYGLVLDGTT